MRHPSPEELFPRSSLRARRGESKSAAHGVGGNCCGGAAWWPLARSCGRSPDRPPVPGADRFPAPGPHTDRRPDTWEHRRSPCHRGRLRHVRHPGRPLQIGGSLSPSVTVCQTAMTAVRPVTGVMAATSCENSGSSLQSYRLGCMAQRQNWDFRHWTVVSEMKWDERLGRSVGADPLFVPQVTSFSKTVKLAVHWPGMSAIIAENNLGCCYRVARWRLSASSARQRLSAYNW